MKKILTIALTLTITLTVAAQTGRQLKVYMKGGLVDKVQVATDAYIGHSRTDLNGTVHDDYVSAVVKDAEGRERQYLISQLDSLVMPNGRRVVFVGDQNGNVNGNVNDDENQNENQNENGSRSLKRSSFSGKFPGAGTGNVTFKWTENDRIRLDVGYESRAEQLSADGTSAAFVFDEADDLQAERYWVYFPDRRVIIKSVQTQTGANNSLHIYDSGDCGTAIATRNGNENDNENENSEHPTSTTYRFTLEHKAAYLCFLPHIDNLPSAKLTKITLSCSAAIAGTYQLSGNGLYNGTATSSTITLNLVPQKNIDFFIGHDALTEQDSCAAYMVIAPQGSNQTFTATYYITDTLSHISKVYRQTFSLKPEANTVYPVTCHILDEEFRTIDLGLSCNWSNVNVGAREPSKTGRTFDSDTAANVALLEQTVVTQWLMPDEDQCEEILEKCQWTFGEYNGKAGYFVEGAAVAKEYGEKLRIFLPCSTSSTKEQCLRQNYRPVEVLMVDLGLSSGVKWAVRNIGATSVEDYGHYYAWGEVEAKDTYTSSNYLYGTQNLGEDFDISGTQNDAAVVNWGGIWRMPTKKDLEELKDSCSWTWSSINGVNGYIITKKVGGTGNKIFLPAAGYINEMSHERNGSGGVYMSSIQGGSSSPYNSYAWTLAWNSSTRMMFNYNAYSHVFNSNNNCAARYIGHSVRPVAAPNAAMADGVALNIVTDSAIWKLGDTEARLYGTLSCTKPFTGSITVGFVVGDSAGIVQGKERFDLHKIVSVGGSYDLSVDVYDNIGYWYRAYVDVGDTIFYGKARHYGYEMVDLGLSVKWANMNLGADAPEDFGYYYAWGETEPKSSYANDSNDPNNYKYGTQNLGEDYNIAGTDNDAAHVNMGNVWRMPTKAELEELKNENNCRWEWTSLNNVTGYRVTSLKPGYTDRSIFLPAAGYMDGTSHERIGTGGVYMSSIQGSSSSPYNSYAWTLAWNSGTRMMFNNNAYSHVFNANNNCAARYLGHSIRPVAGTNGIAVGGMMLNVLTDSATWIFNAGSATLHGTLSSTTPITEEVTVGFIIGENDSITLGTVPSRNNYTQTMNAAGRFTQTLPVHDNMGYYYRAYVAAADTVFYGKTRHYGLEFVDLGLSVMWANMNVGASSPEAYGGYYAWGETQTKNSYSNTSDNPDCYLYGTNNLGYGKDFNIANTVHDAAHVNMGNAWRMPTDHELDELRNTNNCKWEWTSLNNVTGYRVTSLKPGYTDRSIFLPAAGYMDGTSHQRNATGGVYMSSIEAGNHKEYAWTLAWNSGTRTMFNNNAYTHVFNSNNNCAARYIGHSVRAVFTPNAVNADSSVIMNILTDSAAWKVGNDNATIYGTVSSTTPLAEGTKVGFVVGDNATITKDNATLYEQAMTSYGSFSQLLTGVKNKGWWYRAYIETPDSVYYGPARHFGWEMVDLGLPSGTLWANMNVDASLPSDYGGYYAWGETSVKDEYTLENYRWGTTTLGNAGNIQATTYDAAYVNMGSSWCLPTSTQMSELTNSTYCDWAWVTENDVSGWRITGKTAGYTDRSIFLPAAGYWSYENFRQGDVGGVYMTATQSNEVSYCYVLNFNTTHNAIYHNAPYSHLFASHDGNANRYVGHSVRAVAVQKAPRQ